MAFVVSLSRSRSLSLSLLLFSFFFPSLLLLSSSLSPQSDAAFLCCLFLDRFHAQFCSSCFFLPSFLLSTLPSFLLSLKRFFLFTHKQTIVSHPSIAPKHFSFSSFVHGLNRSYFAFSSLFIITCGRSLARSLARLFGREALT